MAIVNERSGGKRTTLTVSITPEDKRALKQAALDSDKFVADLVHEWIAREFLGKSSKKRGK